MAVKYGYLEETDFTNIANAIREKNGETTTYTPSEMPDAIKAIDTKPAASTPVTTTIVPGGSTEIPAGYYESASTVNASLATQLDQIDNSTKESKTITASLTGSTEVTPTTGKVLTSVTVNNPDMSDATATAANIQRGATAYGSDGKLITGTHDETTVTEMTNDATATASDILTGKTAYVKGSKISGTITELGATTYNPSDTDQTISSGQYLSGDQTIAAVTASNLPSSLKEGKTVTASLTEATDVTPSTGKVLTGVTVNAPDTTGTATSSDILTGKTAYVNGSQVTGTIPTNTTINNTIVPGGSTTINSGYYSENGTVSASLATTSEQIDSSLKATGITETIVPGGSKTISGNKYYTSDSTISASLATTTDQIDSSIKEGKTVTASLTEATDVTPSTDKVLTGVTVNAPDMSSADATSDDIVSGKKAYGSDGTLITGTHEETTLTAMTSDATATASDILTGKTAYVNGSKISGTITELGATTYNPSDTDQTISSGQYISGDQTIAAVTASNLPSSLKENKTITASLTEATDVTPSTGKVLTGVTVNAPDMSSADATADDIVSGKKAYGSDGTLITGTHEETSGADTSDATATAADILSGKTAYISDGKTTGTLEVLNYYSSTAEPTSDIGEVGELYIKLES